MIFEALLQIEKNQVNEFLLENGLKLDNNVDKTLYIKEDDKIIATISKDRFIIKCLAVDKKYRGNNYATILVSEIISSIIYEGYNYYQVFTKLEYKDIFIDLGFKELVSTLNTIVLESKGNNINDYLYNLKKRLIFYTDDVAGIVLNANPFTLGHLHLVLEASKNHEHVIVFILEEDKSYYSFKERFSLAYLALRHLSNVTVLPSSSYIVSSLTFPSYFIKDEILLNEEYALIDALIFSNYFMKELNIKYRYVGEEETNIMVIYNNTLKEVLKDKLVVIPRYNNISASYVRELVKNGKIDDAKSLIPDNIWELFKDISHNKANS